MFYEITEFIAETEEGFLLKHPCGPWDAAPWLTREEARGMIAHQVWARQLVALAHKPSTQKSFLLDWQIDSREWLIAMHTLAENFPDFSPHSAVEMAADQPWLMDDYPFFEQLNGSILIDDFAALSVTTAENSWLLWYCKSLDRVAMIAPSDVAKLAHHCFRPALKQAA